MCFSNCIVSASRHRGPSKTGARCGVLVREAPFRVLSRGVMPWMMRRFITTSARATVARATQAHRSGTLYLGFAAATTAGAALTYLSWESDKQQRHQLRMEFNNMLVAARVEAEKETAAKQLQLEGLQTLWTGKILTVDHRLQGHLMLRGCRVGQEVEILEEGVGQDKRYLTVIDRATGAFGLYLPEWIERQ